MPTPAEMEINQLLHFAYQHHGAGRVAEAERLYQRILALKPDHVMALQALGALQFQSGRHDAAARLLGRLITLDRRNPDFHYNFAVALKAAGRLDEAAVQFSKAAKLKPNFAEAHYELGNVFASQEKWTEAAEQYQHALAINPRYAEAHTNLGNVFMEQGRQDEALAQWQQAVAAKPDYAVALMNIGVALIERGKVDEAIAHYRQVLRLNPNSADAHYNLGNALREQGAMAEAITHYDQALKSDPNYSEARFARCMAQLPILYASEAEISERRTAYEQHLLALRDEAQRMPAIGSLATGVGSNQPFYLAYQGQNDRDLQKLYGDLLSRIMADRYPAASMPRPPGPHERVKVGFVSGHFRLHSVWKIPLGGWITQLDRKRFQLFGYHTGNKRDAITETVVTLCDRFVKGPLSLDRWRQAIHADAPHVLIYLDVGMDKIATQLAAQRLAPTQCMTWGHPDTTGLPTLDYFLSSDLMEPSNGQDHYTEKLVRLPNLSFYYEPLEHPVISLTRADLGLRTTATVFWCGQSLFKYLPQFDEVFPRIAREAGDCQFVFIEYPRGHHVTEMFRQRLNQAFSSAGLNAADHCIILPRLEPERFIAAVEPCDIVLDSIGWSGINSTLESLTYSLPIVTMAGPLMRGRHTTAVLQMMDVTETATETIDDYVSTAVRLAKDVPWRMAIKNRIVENKARLYRDRACITALEEFLDRVARGKGDT